MNHTYLGFRAMRVIRLLHCMPITPVSGFDFENFSLLRKGTSYSSVISLNISPYAISCNPAGVVNESMATHFCWREIKNPSAYSIVSSLGCFPSHSSCLSFILLVFLHIQSVGSKWVHVSSILGGKKLFFFRLYFQSYTQVGFGVGHHITRKPPLGDITNRNASFTCFSNYFVMIGNNDPS